jgi:hypothetical protein
VANGKWIVMWIAVCAVFSAAQAAEKRSKDIRFEDSVVEGMNQNSKDSLDTIGKKDQDEKPHLYKKRQDYKAELRTLSRELGQQP